MNRRSFITAAIGVVGVTTVGPILFKETGISKKVRKGIFGVQKHCAGSVSDYEKNSGKIVNLENKPVLLIRKQDGDFTVLSANCKQDDCLLQYRTDNKKIICANHKTVYDLKGQNISGPSTEPLIVYNTHVENNELIITT